MMRDVIELHGLEVFAYHGVFEHEQAEGQTFVIDLALELDLSEAAATDDLAATVNYGLLAHEIANATRATRFQLIEALAVHLCDVVLAHDLVDAVTVKVGKPQAPIDETFGTVAVTLRRGRDSA